MGNSTSRVVGCFAPNEKENVSLGFLEPLDEGLGHSFCYVRPVIADSPAITPSNSERYTVDSSMFDSETHSGSFRQEIVEGPSKNFAETTFKTISGASVSANASTARTPTVLLSGDTQEPAASFESTASFAAIPLQPVPRGSGPLNGFMSGPLERGFMSGPLDKGTFMSGPLDLTDRSNFSAPLGYGQKRGFGKLMRSALSRTFSKRSRGPGWIKRFFLHRKEEKSQTDTQRDWDDVGPSEPEYSNSRNLQWAHGKAGEDRVHVVLSEEQGWLFVGIYDGFSGPDAPDFLMSNLYKAIDKELEGLLWDYDDKPQKSSLTSDHLETDTIEASSASVTELCDEGVTSVQMNDAEECDEGVTSIQINEDENGRKLTADAALCDELEGADEITEEKTSTIDIVQVEMARTTQGHGAISSEDITCQVDAPDLAATNSAKNSRKSKRLCELLQMELLEEKQARLPHLVNMKEELCSRDAQLVSCARENSDRIEGADALKESEGVSVEDSKVLEHKYMVSFTSVGHKQMAKSLIGSKLRKMYKKQIALQKRFFPWSYDWHREKQQADESTVNTPAVIRRCKSGPVDHDAVLRAMVRALATTEEAYMDMVERSLDRNPELALMGSCVLVMLMKDQDVYVMNLGDSRVILAQDRLIEAKDDARSRNRSRESIVRVELDRISEESPMRNPNSRVCSINKNREISLCRLKMRALQLSTDHSTSIEEEVSRIKAEHVEDIQAVLNDRVKGQLIVTRAFGAGFLKKPNFNDALLEMFRIDYIGSSPYLSCIPSVHHQRLCSSDHFLVLSSDGLYQYFNNEEVVSHVAWFIENVPEGDPAQYLISELLFRAATKNGMDFHELLDIPHGDRRKYHDDVSVMVISLEGRIWRSSG